MLSEKLKRITGKVVEIFSSLKGKLKKASKDLVTSLEKKKDLEKGLKED